MALLIDGGYGEGGGQIMRTSIAFSSLFLQPIRIINIRKNRKPPGLKIQHYHSVNLARKITKAEVKGLEIRSMELEYRPKGIFGDYYVEKIETAGSISLVLQLILPFVVFADDKTTIEIQGGTDVNHSPTMNYVKYIILPYFQRFADINLEIIKRGFYPKGGGYIRLTVNPKIKRNEFKSKEEFLNYLKQQYTPLILDDKEDVEVIKIYSVASKQLKERKVCERINSSFKNIVEKEGYKIRSYIEYVNSLSIGVASTVIIEKHTYVTGYDMLGEKRLTSEKIGEILARKTMRFINSRTSVDEHLSDNLVPILALIGGEYTTPEKTGHLETNVWVVNKFFDKPIVELQEDKNKVIVRSRY